jgi:Fur family ferric uptake transcriptional regulator
MAAKQTLQEANARLRRAGGRVTAARVQVLGVLLEAGHALSHHDIEDKLRRAAATDRVTLYRVLDWLVERQLAHRISSTDRARRYSIVGAEQHDHPHFHCGRCGKLLCLGQRARQNVRLPRGYRPHRIELTVTGLCADCNRGGS